MDTNNLHPLEIKILLNFDINDILDEDIIISKLGYNIGQINQSISWLLSKNIVSKLDENIFYFYELTEFGLSQHRDGLIEQRIIDLLKTDKKIKLEDLALKLELEQKDIGSCYGLLSKEKVISIANEGQKDESGKKMNQDTTLILLNDTLPLELRILKSLIDKLFEKGKISNNQLNEEEIKILQANSKKRGASNSIFRVSEKKVIRYKFENIFSKYKKDLKDKNISGDEINTLDSKIISSGSWKNKSFREYDVENLPKTKLLIGRRNEYCKFLEELKDDLVNLGFSEFDGDIVQNEFWNCDSLYMPQFHPARGEKDTYYVENPTHSKSIEQPFLDNVAKTHEDGWMVANSKGFDYTFDRDFTRRLILRTQGTVISARNLNKAKNPSRYFGTLRCFRYDQVDRTHLPDFYQTEGIVAGENVNIKTLLGLLEMFALDIAKAKDVKFVPGYFPFTEPSIEVHIKHPVLGWMELGGSGIFRPEVTKPQGIDYPVIAWGIGIDRMAMVRLGINDLRDLFTYSIDDIRQRRS